MQHKHEATIRDADLQKVIEPALNIAERAGEQMRLADVVDNIRTLQIVR